MKNRYLGAAVAAMMAAGLGSADSARAESYSLAQEGYVNEALEDLHRASVHGSASFISGAFTMHELRGATLSEHQMEVRDRLEDRLSGFAGTEELRKLEAAHRKDGGEAVKRGALSLAELEDAGSILLDEDHKMRQGTLATIDAFTGKGLSEEDAKRATLRLLGSQMAPEGSQADLFSQIAEASGGKLTAEDLGARAGMMKDGLAALGQVEEKLSPEDMREAYAQTVHATVDAQAKAPGLLSKQFARWFMSPHQADRAGPNPTKEAEQASMQHRADLDPGRIGSAITDFDKKMAAKAAERGEGLDDQGAITRFFSGSQDMAEAKILEEIQFRRDFAGAPAPVKPAQAAEVEKAYQGPQIAVAWQEGKAIDWPQGISESQVALEHRIKIEPDFERIKIDADFPKIAITFDPSKVTGAAVEEASFRQTRDERVAAAAARRAERANGTSERDARVTEMARQKMARLQGASQPRSSGQEIE